MKHVFNSLGSNYDGATALRALLPASPDDPARLAAYLESRYGGGVLLLHKGREALALALRAANIPEGSGVIVNGFTCFAVYEAIAVHGFRAVYADIDPEMLHFTAAELARVAEQDPGARAVIVQNTLGYPCDMKRIEEVCRTRNLVLIEDLAHSAGARYADGREAGTVGDFVALSFSQDKIIDGVSGGAAVARGKQRGLGDISLSPVGTAQELKERMYPLLAQLVRRTYGFLGAGKILHELMKRLGILSRPMDGVTATPHALAPWHCALVTAQWSTFEEDQAHRRAVATAYAQTLAERFLFSGIVNAIPLSANLRFPVRTERRGDLVQHLARRGVHVSDVWYDAPVAPARYLPQAAYRGECPNAEEVASRILNLPTHRAVTEADARRIAQLINQWEA